MKCHQRLHTAHSLSHLAGHAALHKDEPPFDVQLVDPQALNGDLHLPHVARHFLALDHLAGVLPLPRAAQHAVRHGVAVRGVLPLEAVALHAALEALALRDAANVDELAGVEVPHVDPRAHRQRGVGRHVELREVRPRLHALRREEACTHTQAHTHAQAKHAHQSNAINVFGLESRAGP